jgi:spore maturation protein CgeB
MKVLVIGYDFVWSIEHYYIKYLQEAGHETKLISAISGLPRQSLIFKIWNRLFPVKNFFLTRFNKKVLSGAKAYQPQWVWVFKGMELYPATIRSMKEQGCRLVNYNPDHPFAYVSIGSGNANVSAAIPYFDIYYTYSKKIAAELALRFSVKTGILPFGYELDETVAAKVEPNKEISACCFIGNPDAGRVQLIKILLEANLPVHVFGHDWNNWLSAAQHPNLAIGRAVYGDDFWILLRRYRVQLNFFREHNDSAHNMRSFEIAAIGGIQLAPDSPDHRSFFDNEKEIFLFRTPEEMIRKAQYLLDMDAAAAGQIRTWAKARSRSSGYDYKSRTEKLLLEWEELK